MNQQQGEPSPRVRQFFKEEQEPRLAGGLSTVNRNQLKIVPYPHLPEG